MLTSLFHTEDEPLFLSLGYELKFVPYTIQWPYSQQSTKTGEVTLFDWSRQNTAFIQNSYLAADMSCSRMCCLHSSSAVPP